MTIKETHNTMVAGLECLKKVVREERRKKALLGHYAVINCDGKACRVPAEEALKIAERG